MNKIYIKESVIEDLRKIYNVDSIEEIKIAIEKENSEYEIVIEKESNES